MRNFISEYRNQLPEMVCDNLISLFEERKDLHKSGVIAKGKEIGEFSDWKKSTEINLNPRYLNDDIEPDFAILTRSLLMCLNDGLKKYREEYTFQNEDKNFVGIDAILEWQIDWDFNLQRYLPGEGYKVSHCEVPGSHVSKRVLVWMFYLNDVDDNGGTEFQFQNYICKAEKGKLVIWPPYWTHYHRGIVSDSETKYIVTGWCSFKD